MDRQNNNAAYCEALASQRGVNCTSPRAVGEFKGYIDGEPAVRWFDRKNMPQAGDKLFLDPARAPVAEPRTWSILLTSANHGTVGPVGSTFPHAGEKHERVLVVEVPAAAGAPSGQVNLKLVAAPSASEGASVDTQALRDLVNQFLGMAEKHHHDERACLSKWGEIVAHIDQHVASQVLAARDAQRAIGRAEAVQIILGLSAEDALDGCIGNERTGFDGEWDAVWKEDKLRELFRADDAAWSFVEQAVAKMHDAQWELSKDRMEASFSVPAAQETKPAIPVGLIHAAQALLTEQQAACLTDPAQALSEMARDGEESLVSARLLLDLFNALAAAPAISHSGEGAAPSLTDDDITIIWQTMPGGPAGWLKSFGFLQFARAVEDEVLSRVQVEKGGSA